MLKKLLTGLMRMLLTLESFIKSLKEVYGRHSFIVSFSTSSWNKVIMVIYYGYLDFDCISRLSLSLSVS